MSYFNHFPLVKYGTSNQVNLTRRTAINEEFKTNPAYYYEHNVIEGDTPENLADRFYDDADLAWVILQFNDIVNVFEQWPKSQYELDEYIKDKYDDPNGIHHYISLISGSIVDPVLHPTHDRMPVTNYEYETDINDDKRTIKLVLPEFIGTIVMRHKELIIKGL
jgi:hypothetical protein